MIDRLEEVDEMGEQMRARGEELDLTGYTALIEFLTTVTACILLGKTEDQAARYAG